MISKMTYRKLLLAGGFALAAALGAAGCQAANVLRPTIEQPAREKLQPVFDAYTAKIDAAFKASPDLRKQMQASLKEISDTADSAKRASLIAAYQKRYHAAYVAVLAKGGVDLTRMTADLQAAVPGYVFTLKDDLGITFTKKKPKATAKKDGESGSAAGTPTVVAVSGDDFSFVKEFTCHVVAGNDAYKSGGYLRFGAWAVEAGQCDGTARMDHRRSLPSGQRVRIDLTYDLDCEASAVGILGVAGADVYTLVRPLTPSVTQDFLNEHDLELEVHCDAIAPFLWAASENQTLTGGRFTVEDSRAGDIDIMAESFGFALAGGIVAGTSVKAQVHRLRTTITFTPE